MSRKEYQKEYRRTHKKQAKLYRKIHRNKARNYWKKNRVKFSKQRKIHYKLNVEKILKRRKEYYNIHKEECKQRMKIYYLKNKLKLLKEVKKYNHIHKIEKSKYMKDYCQTHKEQRRKYIKNKRKTSSNFKIRCNLTTRIWDALKRNVKSSSTMKLLGCNIEFLKEHLQKQFTKGMTWKNYGKWHIDHIKPCASFDLSKESEQKKCFNYTNLQPLWAKDNLIKGRN